MQFGVTETVATVCQLLPTLAGQASDLTLNSLGALNLVMEFVESSKRSRQRFDL